MDSLDNLPEGLMAPCESVGIDGRWEIFFWSVSGKGNTAQMLAKENGEIAYGIFFSTKAKAKAFLLLPNVRRVTVAEIEKRLENCPWIELGQGRLYKRLEI